MFLLTGLKPASSTDIIVASSGPVNAATDADVDEEMNDSSVDEDAEEMDGDSDDEMMEDNDQVSQVSS